jgi:chemotaxis protein MotB
VVRELIARGVPASRLSAVGMADTHPLAPDDDPAGRGRNRRVEFLLTRAADRGAASDAAAAPATPAAPDSAAGPASGQPSPTR